MTVSVWAKGLLLAIPTAVFAAALPAAASAQGMSEWGIWDSPRRTTMSPPSRSDDEDDQPDYGNNGSDPGDDGNYDDRRDYGSHSDPGGDDQDDPRFDDRRDDDPGDQNEFERRPPQDGGQAENNATPGVDGGQRPYIAAAAPPQIRFTSSYETGSIIIDTSARKLYYVTSSSTAFAYSIGVGREGFSWTGSEKVSRIQDWPDWYPPADMRRRKPELPARMLGGIRNPLGVKAIYLGNTLYRIHGTNDPKSIGKAESSGCFRMLNENVLHLASLVHVGTPVTVVHSLERGVAAANKPPKRQDQERSRVRDRGDNYGDAYNRYDDETQRYRADARYRDRYDDRYRRQPDPYWADPY